MSDFISHIAGIANVAPEELNLRTPFRFIPGWDSLAMLSLIVMYEDEYGKTITNDDIKKATTIGDLEALAMTSP
jgi:acyl carrier protein